MSEYIDYVWEQLYGATLILASSTLPLRARVLDAVSSRVERIFHQNHAEKLPLELSQAIDRFEEKTTQYGSYNATIEKMRDQEVEETIEEIIDLFSKACRASRV